MPEDHLTQAPDLEVISRRRGATYTVLVSGELDVSTVAELDEELRRVEDTDARSIVLDLSGLRFMDSSGLHLLVRAHARSRTHGDRLSLRSPAPAVMRVIQVAGLADVLPLTPAR